MISFKYGNLVIRAPWLLLYIGRRITPAKNRYYRAIAFTFYLFPFLDDIQQNEVIQARVEFSLHITPFIDQDRTLPAPRTWHFADQYYYSRTWTGRDREIIKFRNPIDLHFRLKSKKGG